jgi:hypothetical protein
MTDMKFVDLLNQSDPSKIVAAGMIAPGLRSFMSRTVALKSTCIVIN